MQPRDGGLRAVRRALAYLQRYRREAVGAVVALLLVAAANLATPQLIRVAIDVGYTQAQPSVLAEAVAGLVALAFVRGLFTFVQGYLAERASQGVAFDLREALFAPDPASELQLLRRRADRPARDARNQRRRAGAHLRWHRRHPVDRVARPARGHGADPGLAQPASDDRGVADHRADRVVADELRAPRRSAVRAGPTDPWRVEHDPARGPVRAARDKGVRSRGL